MLSGDLKRLRGTKADSFSGAADPLFAINGRGDLSVVQGLSPMAESVRLGNTWQLSIATASAFNHVAAFPTTRSELVLFNGEPADGKSYIIEGVWAVNVVKSIDVSSAYTILGQIVPSGSAQDDDEKQLITSRSGKSSYDGNAKRCVADTSLAQPDGWEVLGSVPFGPNSSIGLACVAHVNGGLIVHPGGALCLNLIVGTAAGKSKMGVVWTESVLDLG